MKPLIVANWKSYFGTEESVVRAAQIDEAAEAHGTVDVVVCPSFIAIPAVADAMAFATTGAQNLWIGEGNSTGEVTPEQVAEFCNTVIIGHSERRNLFHEDAALNAKKIRAALNAGLTAVLAVGESATERRAGKTNRVLAAMLTQSLKTVRPKDASSLVIAYEPVWAISSGKVGSGKNAKPADVAKALTVIQSVLQKKFGTAARKIRLLYGGSTDDKNCAAYFELPMVDGALVGAASRTPSTFERMIQTLAQLKGAN